MQKIIQVVWKLLQDQAFKDLIYKIALVEARWLAGDVQPEDALTEIVALLKEYFKAYQFVADLA
jgi:hypothetical protein